MVALKISNISAECAYGFCVFLLCGSGDQLDVYFCLLGNSVGARLKHLSVFYFFYLGGAKLFM